MRIKNSVANAKQNICFFFHQTISLAISQKKFPKQKYCSENVVQFEKSLLFSHIF